ncbi:MAG: hypothetical protein H0V52_03030 [Acidimicrobiia bacterium]|nr:hypothetical protein [Acidimicrobiia bacterium]
MSPRLALELTSERADGSWTWRAAGARQPKGVLDGKLLPPGVVVGDVVRAEADIDIDGITVTTVLPPKGGRREPERLEVLGSGREEPAVTSTMSDRGGRGGQESPPGERPARRPRRDEAVPGRRDGPSRLGGASTPGSAASGRPQERPRRERPVRPPRPELPSRPKPKKLRPGRVHRDALMAELPPEQQPIAEMALRGGMPGVRTALNEQSIAARAEGKPEVPAAAVLAIAEGLLPRLRVAEWFDRADAALADAEELTLADLRSVVVSADDVAREEQTREPAAKLRAILERRTEVEQREWHQDLEQSMAAGRVVRALRLSTRAPQPGERLAPEAATALAEAAGAAMTTEITPDRWATLLDAVAYSAVRRSVTPAGVPAEPGEELLAQVRKHAGRVPAIAALFGVEAPETPSRSSRGRRPDRSARQAPRQAESSATPGPDAPPRPRRIPPPPVVPANEEATAPEATEPGADGTSEATPDPEAAPGEAPEAVPAPPPATDDAPTGEQMSPETPVPAAAPEREPEGAPAQPQEAPPA